MPQEQGPNKNPAGDLRSEFAGDPDMQAILELFVQEMPSRVSELLSSWERRELQGVARIAHQLKGAGGGYGFPSISDAAARLERSVVSLRATPPNVALEEISSQVNALVGLCRRVSAR